MMKAGFAKNDITPPLGGELAGFGPYLHRRSVAVHEPLWARAMALECNGQKIVVVSCDILGITMPITRRVRNVVAKHSDVCKQAIMIASSHTHSGPNPTPCSGWGEWDPSYAEFLPLRIARACIDALANLENAEFGYAEVPCEGIAVNREYEARTVPPAQSLRDNWRPDKPQLTDTTCHVLTFHTGSKLLGFISCYGCHPVVCCEDTYKIHGDFCGVATNFLERKYPGSVGLFIQGAHGDVNTCVSHCPEEESFTALDIISTRFANVVEKGIEQSSTYQVSGIHYYSIEQAFSRKPWDQDQLKELLHNCLAQFSVSSSNCDFTSPEAKRGTVLALTLRKLIRRMDVGESLVPPGEIYGLRIGDIKLLGSGFEMFQAIKNEIIRESSDGITIVTSLVNDGLGYAFDQTTAEKGGYAVDFAPFILGTLPYANIHNELVSAFLQVDKVLHNL